MQSGKRPVDWVNPLIDTAKPRVRWVFTATACRPFGMVRLSPDTDPRGVWDAGYRYNSERIHGFSHIHAWQLAGVPVMPTIGQLRGPAGSDVYASRFSHADETVTPGYHSVLLSDYGIRAELAATERVGFHRYTFPAADRAHILLDLGAELGPSQMSEFMVRRVGDAELEGYVGHAPTRRRPKPCRIFFVTRFDKPFESLGGWADDGVMDDVGKVDTAGRGPAQGCGAFVRYTTAPGEVIQLKVGLSYVSMEGARLNLESELPHWDFDRLCRENRDLWDRWLSRIQVEGGTDAHRKKFYTDVWRTLVSGHTISDVDGRYSDMTGGERAIRRAPLGPDGCPAHPLVNGQDCFWGAHWSLSTLHGLACPELVSHYCNYLVRVYEDGGLIPRGPSGGNYTFVMIAAHSTAYLAAAYMRGIRSFDYRAAYGGMRKNAFPGGLMSKAGYEQETCVGGGVEYYMERGYVPERPEIRGPIHVDGGAQTLEYAYDDWCLAQMARALGHEEDHALFMARAGNYAHLFDASIGRMRPRNLDGSWLEPFDPLSLKGWCEGNGWQYAYYVPHDVQGLIRLMGGREAFTQLLDYAFRMAEPMGFYAPKPELRRDAAYVNYGNENGRFVAHLFNHAGAPWLTQMWARRVKERVFSSVAPMGFCEDDDNGLAAATSALLALGLFDVRGGAALDPVYEIASPLFDRIVVGLDDRYYPGGEFVIEARHNSPENIYIQSATLNGQPLHRPWFFHREYAAGGKLVLELGPAANMAWGSRPEDAPPSMSSER